MPAPIIAGLGLFLQDNLVVSVWEGQIPRYDELGNPITPEQPGVDFPVIKLFMREPGFKRNWTQLDPYDDEGQILVQMWGTAEDQLVTPVSGSPVGLMDRVEQLFANADNWPNGVIPLGGPTQNPYYVIAMLLDTWYVGQEEDNFGPRGELLFRADMFYQCRVHGAVTTGEAIG